MHKLENEGECMIKMSFIKDYLPLLAVVVGSSLAYLYGKRNSNLSNFNNQAKENLKELLEPMYYHLRDIMNIDDQYEKEYNLKTWFNKYSPYEASLHKLADKSLIENFLNLREMYKNLYKKRSGTERELFYKQLKGFYNSLEKQYWFTFTSIYQDYHWYNRILNTHFTFRKVLEFMKHLRNFSQFFAFFSVATILLGLYFRLLKKFSFSDTILIPSEIMSIAGSLFSLSIVFSAICELVIPGKSMSLVNEIPEWIIKIRNNIFGFLKKK